ncbi:MAG: hypothetical protein GTN73_06080 [Candidatus Aminicenantes bacterium]|nr:hypothetical protein [Candidatus Aminicenantes bacterium]
MLKKEINDVLKQIVFFTAAVLLLPAFLIITTIISDQSYFSVFFPMFQFGLIFWAFFMGSSLFSLEHGQRGMEYLLSLPYSRLQLIGFKIVPRIIAVMIFFVAFWILYNAGGEDLAALSFISFTFTYFSLFLISLSLSASSQNFLVLFVSSLFSLIIYFELLSVVIFLVTRMKRIPYYRLNYRYFFTGELDPYLTGFILLAAIVLLLPLLVSFILSFKKFDIRPAKVYNKRYLKFFTPIFIFCFIISAFFASQGIHIGYKQYYLTLDLKLIESHPYSGIKIYEHNKVHKIKGDFDFSWPSLVDNEYVYQIAHNKTTRSYNKIIRLNTSDYTVEVLYKGLSERSIGWRLQKYDQTIAFVERKRKKDFHDIQLVLVDEASKEVTRIPLEYKLLEKSYFPISIWTNKTEGKRFWLISTEKNWKNQILRIWEDGRIEDIGESQKAPCYVNRMLISYTEEDVIISMEKEGRFEAIRKIPNSQGFKFGTGYWRANLNDLTFKEIFGWRRGPTHPIYAKLNLENFEIEEIGETKGHLHYFSPDEYYFIEIDHVASEVKVYEYKERKQNLLKTFSFNTTEKRNRFRPCIGGIVFREGKKVRAYAFPDLKEIKFKKL